MYLFNQPHYFVKGIAEQRVYDSATGNLVARETVLSDAASEITDNFDEIIGFANRLVAMLPNSRRITGTYTAQSFSLESKQIELGGELGYNGVAPVCEEVTAGANGAIYVTRQPALYYIQPASDTEGIAYVRSATAEADGTVNTGTNVGVALEETSGSGYLVGYTGVEGTVYTVHYFTAVPTAQELAIPDVPVVRSFGVEQIFGIYAKQNGSFGDGTLTHKLHIVYPHTQFTAGGGVSGSQTAITTTNGTWTAISADEAANGDCEACDFAGTGAYYVIVPCAANASSISGLAVVGGGITVAASASKQIPLKYVMNDNSIVQAVYTDSTYVSSAEGVATVSASGVVTGVAAGSAVITITLKADTTKTTTCAVTVTA